jgi:hypothetical protein
MIKVVGGCMLNSSMTREPRGGRQLAVKTVVARYVTTSISLVGHLPPFSPTNWHASER